jgi:hypothetical protein
MSGTLEIDHKEMHDIKSASALTDYSRDHIASLARAGKIVAAQIDRQWYIDIDSLEQYTNITALEQEVKQKHLSEERRTSRLAAESLKKRKHHKSKRAAAYTKKLHTNLAGFALVLSVTGIALSQFAPTMVTSSERQLASVKVPTAATLENLVAPDYVSLTKTETTFSDGTVSVATMAEPADAIIILPNNLPDTAAVFSDEVEINTSNGSTTLRLVEQDRILPLNVVTVPITEETTL